MATISKKDVLDAISEMSVMDVVELIKDMEEKFGVSAASATIQVAAPIAGQAAADVEEQTEFNVVLTNFGSNKVAVIKIVRELTGLGLKEAKDLVEGLPSNVKESVAKGEAENIKKKLEEAGASVEIK